MKYLLTTLLLFSVQFSLANSTEPIALEDAIVLRRQHLIQNAAGKWIFDLSTQAKKDAVYAILDKYNNLDWTDNPFIQDFDLGTDGRRARGGMFALMMVAPTGVADITVENKSGSNVIIEALTQFIITRMKKELQVAFFTQLEKKLKSPQFYDCRILLPETYRVILSLGDDIYRYQLFLTNLRNAFSTDLQNLAPHLEELLTRGQFLNLLTQDQADFLNNAVKPVFTAVKDFMDQKHPGYILDNIMKGCATRLSANNMFQFFHEVIASVKNTDVGNVKRYWALASDLKELNDPVTCRLYVALLFQRIKTLNNPVLKIMFDHSNISFLQNFATQLSASVGECEDLLEKSRTAVREENIKLIPKVLAALNRSMESISGLCTATHADTLDHTILTASGWLQAQQLLIVTQNCFSLTANYISKDYTLMILNTRKIYEVVFLDNPINKSGVGKVMDFIFEKGLPLAQMAQATTSEEAYAALDNFADPVGSYRIKRDYPVSVSLNAYGGLYAAHEVIDGIDPSPYFNSYGFAGLVGFGLNFGKFNKTGQSSSFSIFLSAIDVGALTAWRLQDKGDVQVASYEWRDVFSPGAYAIYGFKNSPLCLALGIAQGPRIWQIKDGTGQVHNEKYTRASFSVLIDIPIIHLAKYR